MDADTSRTLLARVACIDDREAWDQFVHRYAPRIFHWCRRYQLQESDAADITQEVLAKLVRTMRDFRYDASRGSFRGWLKTVTANAVHDLRSSRQRVGQGSGETAVLRMLAAFEDPHAVEQLGAEIERSYQQELFARAEQLVQQRVQPRTWEAFRLTAKLQRTPADVATELRMPVSEVYVAKSRVLKMLRQVVQELTDGDP